MRRISLFGRHPRSDQRGQALVEFAMIVPIFILVLVGIIVLGIGVFYNQQLTNAAREAARYAATNSATAPCPVVASLNPVNLFGYVAVDPNTGHTAALNAPISYVRCEVKPWPNMVAHARSKVFGLNAANVQFTACWSSYRTATQYDTPPPGTYLAQGVVSSTFAQCTIGGYDPTSSPGSIGCANNLATGDTGSDMSANDTDRVVANRVTVYACYVWSPPMAGFLLIPSTVTFRAVISEPIQRQQ
jgi:hypothetical protein